VHLIGCTIGIHRIQSVLFKLFLCWVWRTAEFGVQRPSYR